MTDIICMEVGMEKILNLVEKVHAAGGTGVSLLHGSQAVQSPVWIGLQR